MSQGLGRFVVLEGTDGSGTTTQCELLVAALAKLGVRAIATREPTAGPIGLLLREVLEKRLKRQDGGHTTLDWSTLALLFAADRTDHVHHEILPNLQRGVWVISDRYDLSSLIYQSITAPDPALALEWVRALNAQALRPDLVLVLDVAAEVAAERRMRRGGPEELFERRELQAKLARAYRAAETYASRDPIEHIDGERSRDEVFDCLFDTVRKRYLI